MYMNNVNQVELSNGSLDGSRTHRHSQERELRKRI